MQRFARTALDHIAADIVGRLAVGTREAADRSRDYYASRWASVFGDTAPRVDIGEVGSTGAIYRVRVPTASVERANTICAAIRADGGGCFITSGN